MLALARESVARMPPRAIGGDKAAATVSAPRASANFVIDE
jgi:hypothetical protein